MGRAIRILSVTGIVILTGMTAFVAGYHYRENVLEEDPPPPGQAIDAPTHYTALDGDTVLLSGKAYRIRGVDAPELGPWAECWSEALAGGNSKSELERHLNSSQYTLSNIEQREDGVLLADLLNENGISVAEDLVPLGIAADTDKDWDWCDKDNDLAPVREDAARPHGPNLWWPSNHVYDERAGDG